MFLKRKPKCPITTEDRTWILEHLKWINHKIVTIDNQATILPTEKFFNWEFTGELIDAQFVLKQIGVYYDIETEHIGLDFHNNSEMLHWDDKSVTIQLHESRLARPGWLITNIACFLSEYILLCQEDLHVTKDEFVMLRELLTIAFGFGVLLGNTKYYFERWQEGKWSGYEYAIEGILPQQITAHAIAEIEIRRSDEIPDWTDILKSDFRGDFKKSMNFLIFEEQNGIEKPIQF